MPSWKLWELGAIAEGSIFLQMDILQSIIDRPGRPCDQEEKMDSHRWASSQEGSDGVNALKKPNSVM